MIKKRKKEATALAKSELRILESLKATLDESDDIPSAIHHITSHHITSHHLQQGGLHTITPRIIPLLRAVVDKMASLVNE